MPRSRSRSRSSKLFTAALTIRSNIHSQNGGQDNDKAKKEIIKKIVEIDKWIAADMELGCGFALPDAYAGMEEETARLYEELAHLRHYKNADEMFHDERGL